MSTSQPVQSSGTIRREILEFRTTAIVTRAVELNFLVSLLLLVLLALTSPFRSTFIALGDVITTKGSVKAVQGIARLPLFLPSSLKAVDDASHGLLDSHKPYIHSHSTRVSSPALRKNVKQGSRRRLAEVPSAKQTEEKQRHLEAFPPRTATEAKTPVESRNGWATGVKQQTPDGSASSGLTNHRTRSNDNRRKSRPSPLSPMACLSSHLLNHTSGEVRLTDSEHCRGLVPGADPDVIKSRDSLGPITTLEQLQALKPGQRVLVVIPKFGLGNSLNGFISSYIFATLMGRRIVFLHAGDYGAVFSSLCDAFHCAFDHIRPPPMFPAKSKRTPAGSSSTNSTFRSLLTWLYNQPGLKKEGGRSIDRNAAVLLHHSDHPVVFAETNALWDRWWQRDRPLKQCVVSALGRDYHAAALNALLGRGPKPQLSATIETILQRHDSGGETRFRKPSSGSGSHGRRLSGEMAAGAWASQHAADGGSLPQEMPDRGEEGGKSGSEGGDTTSTWYPRGKEEGDRDSVKMRVKGCGTRRAQSEEEGRLDGWSGRAGERSVAEGGRLDGWMGAGSVVEGNPVGCSDGEGAMSLQFDVAIHVRTAHQALERPREAALCGTIPTGTGDGISGGHDSSRGGTSGGAEGSSGGSRRRLLGGRGKKERSKRIEAICRKMREERKWQEQRFFSERGWKCLGVLLQSLKGEMKQRGRRLQGRVKEERELRETIHGSDTAGSTQNFPPLDDAGSTAEAGISLSSGSVKQAPVAEPQQQGGTNHSRTEPTPNHPFTIFLATDNEAFRPRFVERLARFGAVYYNGFGVAHLGVAGGNETASRLASLAEFYLMARSRVIIELDASYISTFASTAALLGNSTLLSLPLRPGSLSRCGRPQVVRQGNGGAL